VIGYYIHHHGRGHVHRATAITDALGVPVVGLSSLPRPAGWAGEWVELPLDVPERGGGVAAGDGAVGVEGEGVGAGVGASFDATANGRLHWVPVGVDGLRARMAAISAWIGDARPDALVADVSVEVALLARLHGVPVVTVALPGVRDDAAHALGYDVSTAIIAAWPDEAHGMVTGLSAPAAARLHPVGAISRFPVSVGAGGAADAAPRAGRRRALVLAGAGGDGFTSDAVAAARSATAGWEIVHLGGSSGTWVADPREALREADVVVTHAGQNAIADVAAARRPAIIVPQPRPHDEQAATGRVLSAGGWPAIVLAELPGGGWGELLDAAAALDGMGWRTWNDGRGAERAAAVIARVAAGSAA
jgi:hypothetical protein